MGSLSHINKAQCMFLINFFDWPNRAVTLLPISHFLSIQVQCSAGVCLCKDEMVLFGLHYLQNL